MKIDLEKVKKIITKYKGKKDTLIPLLQEVQKEFNYVPKEAIDLIAKEMDMFPVNIYGVVTFYSMFKLDPPGKHIIKLCQGTACHVMGGKEILDYLENDFGIKVGQTTKDGLFTLERVACLGCCGMAPVVEIDGEFHGSATIQIIDKIIKEIKESERK